MLEFTDLYRKAKREGWSKQEFLIAAAQIEGMYVPSLYEVKYHEDGTIESVTPTHGAPALVQKRIVKDLDTMYYPESFVVPSTDIVFDRAMIELFRGGPWPPFLSGGTHLPSAAHQVQGGAAQAGRRPCSSTPVTRRSRCPRCPPVMLRRAVPDWPKKLPCSTTASRATSACRCHRSASDSFSAELMERVQKTRKSGT